MRVVKSILIKQLNDLTKNPMVTSIFIMFPLLAWIMIRFQGTGEPGEAFMLMSSIAMMSVANMPIITITTYIAEDVENHSLRFMIMAGVKPAQYLAGLAIFSLTLSALAMVAFGFVGELEANQFPMFLGITLMGCVTSVVVGAILGLLAKNIQQASIYTSIFGLGLGFIPMLSLFNPELLSRTFFFYTQQIFVTLMYMALGRGSEAIEGIYEIMGYNFNLTTSILIIAGNIVAFLAIFVLMYKRKGLRG
jgi:ABC-2 type transport system permease protein